MFYPINNILIAQVSQPAQTEKKPSAKDLIIDLLNEVKKLDLRSPSPADSGFPDKMIRHVQKGDIKIVPMPGNFAGMGGAYDAASNTLFYKEFGPEFNKALVHELYHAYQDAMVLPLTKASEVEGPAILISIRYFLYSKGYRTPNFMAEHALLQTANPDWYKVLTPEKISKLVEYALTNDAQVWEKGSMEMGDLYVRIGVLEDYVLSAVYLYVKSGATGPLEIPLKEGGKKLVLSEKDVIKLGLLHAQMLFAEMRMDWTEMAIAQTKLHSLWLDEISVKHLDVISDFDANSKVLDGVSK